MYTANILLCTSREVNSVTPPCMRWGYVSEYNYINKYAITHYSPVFFYQEKSLSSRTNFQFSSPCPWTLSPWNQLVPNIVDLLFDMIDSSTWNWHVIDYVRVRLVHSCNIGLRKLWKTDHFSRDVRKPNFGSVWFRFLKLRTEAKRSNPKFQFPWLFSKPNLSLTNSLHLSHSHKALTFFTLRTQDSGMIGII